MYQPMRAPAAISPATVYAEAAGLRTARPNAFGSITHSHGRAATNWTAARMMPAAKMLRDIGEPGGCESGPTRGSTPAAGPRFGPPGRTRLVYGRAEAATSAGVGAGARRARGVGGGS